VIVWAKVIIFTKKKNNSPLGRLSFVPFGRMKLFLLVRSKNRVTDTDDIIARQYNLVIHPKTAEYDCARYTFLGIRLRAVPE